MRSLNLNLHSTQGTKTQGALYNLKDDPNIIIKGADKGYPVVVWDREDYLKEASKKSKDNVVYNIV